MSKPRNNKEAIVFNINERYTRMDGWRRKKKEEYKEDKEYEATK